MLEAAQAAHRNVQHVVTIQHVAAGAIRQHRPFDGEPALTVRCDAIGAGSLEQLERLSVELPHGALAKAPYSAGAVADQSGQVAHVKQIDVLGSVVRNSQARERSFARHKAGLLAQRRILLLEHGAHLLHMTRHVHDRGVCFKEALHEPPHQPNRVIRLR
jgi:hypothetical protein